MITLENRIIRLGPRALWQWTIYVMTWPKMVGCVGADPVLFAMCALEDHA